MMDASGYLKGIQQFLGETATTGAGEDPADKAWEEYHAKNSNDAELDFWWLEDMLCTVFKAGYHAAKHHDDAPFNVPEGK